MTKIYNLNGNMQYKVVKKFYSVMYLIDYQL